MEKSHNRCATISGVFAGIVVVALLSSILTTVIVQKYNPYQICGKDRSRQESLGFKQDLEWDEVEKVDIAEKNVVLTRDASSGRCYITPVKASPKGETNTHKAKPFRILPEKLSTEFVRYFAGEDALVICGDFDTYLAVEVDAADAKNAAARAKRGTLDMTYEQRTPNCMDLLLLCPDSVGKVQSCYTWIMGVMYMDQTCLAENKFKITMTKPPGRMLKIQQEQWRECLFRRKEGKRC